MFRTLDQEDEPAEGKAEPVVGEDKIEIGHQAVWSLSSAKPGFGVEQLRDDNLDTYWQSDGPQPHLINIHFPRKTHIEELALFLNYKLDESYTPCKIVVKAGSHFHDLKDVKLVELDEPNGWIQIPLSRSPLSAPRTADAARRVPLRAFLLQICILGNHQNGRDSHVRQVKIYGPRKPLTSALEIPHFSAIESSVYSTLR